MPVAISTWHMGWSIYQRYLSVFLHSRKTAIRWLSLVTSGMRSISFVFHRAIGGSTLSALAFPCINGATKVTQHRHVEMVIPIFGCAVRFNPWCVDFISGLSSCENQPWFSWLIVKLLSLLQVKIGLIINLLLVAYSIMLGRFFLWPCLQFLLCCVGCVPGRISMEDTGGIASWSITIALHVQILFILQSLECMPDEPGALCNR